LVETFVASDGYEFTLERRVPTAPPRGRIILLHGIRSHAGWYHASCNKLTAAGYETCFLERRGAGRNLAARGDCPGRKRLLHDIVEFHSAQPPLPTHLVGISWGAKLAVAASAKIRPVSLVLIAPGFVPRIQPSLRERLRILWARLTHPKKLFDVPLNDAELFTDNPEWRAYLSTNPHDLHQATARFFVASVALDWQLKFTTQLPCPALMLLAGNDQVIDNAKTRNYVARWKLDQESIIEYPEMQHTLEFEDTRLTFVDDVLEWLRSVQNKPAL
jgi:alpha-beta hydrolase superfamily lysophospholipase